MTASTVIRSWEGTIPEIPGSHLSLVQEDHPVLMWVRAGILTVRAAGRLYTAHAGEAVWVPPQIPHSAELSSGSVAVPVIAENIVLPPTLARVGVITIPPAWADWLIHALARSFGFASGAPFDPSALVALIADGVSDDEPDVPPFPSLPRDPGARRVVQRLIDDPADDSDLAALSTLANLSSRSLQRRLRDDTGWTLAQWRAVARVRRAANLLRDGHGVEWTAHQVGYATASGFAHAFADLVGTSPARWAQTTGRGDPGGPTRREADSIRRAPPIPPSPSAPSVSPFESFLWVYRGAVSVQSSGTARRLSAGDVIRLPPGVSIITEIADESIVLPLGWREADGPLRVDPARVVRMPRTVEVELFLLHTVIANHFLLRPVPHDDQAFRAVLGSSRTHEAAPVPSHLDRMLRAVMADPSDSRGVDGWASELGVDATHLRREFTRVIGESFPRWRAKARMTEARALLWDGQQPSSVARQLGYAHLPAFTKAFAASHGMPPTAWLRMETGR